VALGAGRGHGAVKLCTAHRGTRSEVSRLIDRLKRRAARPTADRRREIRAVHDDLATNRGDAAEVREDLEVTGRSARTWRSPAYGSTATCKQVRS
jgi:hypothetical protein